MRNVGDEVDSVIRVGYVCGGVGVHDFGRRRWRVLGEVQIVSQGVCIDV